KEIMANCATDASHAHEATSGTDLAAVFEEIGRNLSSLRVTQ
ncbi:MAG: pilus assembly protein, partial [Devosia sp.]|nr:pilus assembly protein [Devosia sp.]